MKHVFIINPTAGDRDRTHQILSMVEQLRKKHGAECQCILTHEPGHATKLARQQAETGEELRIYACGGDGTVNEVANGILGYDNVAMSVVPIGTGNDFLKNFGPEMMKKFDDIENLWDGPEFMLDVIDCNGRAALTIACSGIDARIGADVHKYGKSALLGNKGSYIKALVINFVFRDIASHWTVSVDGVPTKGDYSLVAVCNGRYYGGGFMPVGEANMNDGVLNTLIVKGVSRPTFAKFVGAYSHGGYYKFPHLAKCVTGKVIRIQSDNPDIVTCLDGECFTSDDVTIQLSPHQIRCFGPVGCDPNASLVDRSW